MTQFAIRLSSVNGTHRGGGTGRKALGFVLAAAFLFVVPGMILAADWLAPAADQTVTAPWVKDIAAQLTKDPYRDVFVNAPGEPPHPAVIRYLNGAAQAIQAGNKLLAQSYVDRTLAIFDNGVRRGYYTQADVEPIKKIIRAGAETALKGEEIATAVQEEERWAGYTEQKPLGLVNEDDRMKAQHPVSN
jgi:hypothetical protein